MGGHPCENLLDIKYSVKRCIRNTVKFIFTKSDFVVKLFNGADLAEVAAIDMHIPRQKEHRYSSQEYHLLASRALHQLRTIYDVDSHLVRSTEARTGWILLILTRLLFWFRAFQCSTHKHGREGLFAHDKAYVTIATRVYRRVKLAGTDHELCPSEGRVERHGLWLERPPTVRQVMASEFVPVNML